MVVADTNIIIASIRGNEIARQLLRKYFSAAAISAITEMELYVGANNPSQKSIVSDVLKSHAVLPLTKGISATATKLIKEYNTISRSLFLADALIAATCIEHNLPLVTFNTKDFNIIKGLQLAS